MKRQIAFTMALIFVILIGNFGFIDELALKDGKTADSVDVNSRPFKAEQLVDNDYSEPDSENIATVYTSSGKVETISIPSSASFLNTLTIGNSRTVFLNDLRAGDKLDSSLSNLTLLSEEGYIQNGNIRVIVLVGDEIATDMYSLHSFESTQLESFEANLALFNATLKSTCSDLPFVAIELPYKYVFDVAQEENVGHVFLDRQFHVCLNESVSIVKPRVEWQAIEQTYGHAINGSNVRIAVLDTGIDKTHPDLEGKVLLEKSFTGEPPTDGFGHGTHCASIAAGTGKASNGTFVGVAPGALLLNGKVLANSGGGWTDWIIEGIEWAVNNSADVISMSLGSSNYNDGTDPLSLALDWASQNGVVCSVAAGNSGESGMGTIGSPATSRQAITVGATDKNDSVAYFSSQGFTTDWRLKPDLCAPGYRIIAARANGTTMGTPINSYYTKASGTSMATPHVAGAVALILQAHPTWTPLIVKAALMGNAKTLDEEELWKQGAGRMDVCKAMKTKAVITPPSASLGFMKTDAKSIVNFTIVNTTPTVLYTTYRAEVRCGGEIVPNCTSLNMTFASLRPNGQMGVSLAVGPAQASSYCGWWEVYLNVTMPYSSVPQSISAPSIAYSGGYLTLRLLDEDRRIGVWSCFICTTYPERRLLECKTDFNSGDCKPGGNSGYVHFALKPGLYSFIMFFPFVSGYSDDNYRSCMMERIVNVPFGYTSLNFSLADVKKHIIATKDSKGQDLLIHTYKQSISGCPYYNQTSGTTNMNWTLETQWTSSENENERESRLYPLNRYQKKPMILYSDFNDTEKLSVTFGYYGSNDPFSEVYLLVWKYWNQTLPDLITQSVTDLARYKIYYDFPEVFPVHVQLASYIDFSSKVPDPFSFSHTKHIVPSAVNATYYMTPEIGYYRGVYYIEYSPWRGAWCRSPGQTWRVAAPAPRETGYIRLGDYKFGPYTPGIILHTTSIGSNSTISLTGDLWSNLIWPTSWDMFWDNNCSQNLLGEFPPPYNRANFSLYVDGEKVAAASLLTTPYYVQVFDSRFGVIEYPASYAWNNVTFSWNVTGQRAKIVMELPSMMNVNFSRYQVEFDADRNSTLTPFFDMSLAPMNYSAGETLNLNPQFRNDIVNADIDYSFDFGSTWTTATRLADDFEIHCQSKNQLALRINAEDANGSKFYYCCNPFAYCRDVNIDVLDYSNGATLKVTDVEGQLLNRGVGIYKFALELRSGDDVSFVPVFDNCTFRVGTPISGDNVTISFLGLGIYGKASLTLQRIAGDANSDMRVNVLDLIVIASRLGSVCGDAKWNLRADVNRDYVINVLDLIACVRDFGKTWTQT